MKRIDTANVAVDLFGAGKDGWTDGNPSIVASATQFSADTMNNYQEEICSLIEAQGIVLNGAVHTQLATAITAMIAGRTRLRLPADADVYVATTGDDADLGTAGAPWLTLQRAWDWAADQIDLNGHNVVVHIADGTYAAGVFASAQPVGSSNGTGAVRFLGNTGSPSSVAISAAAANCFYAQGGAQFSISGVKLASGGGGGCGLACGVGGIISASSVEFGACVNAHILAAAGGFIQVSGAYTISGGAATHVTAAQCGNASIAGAAVTLTGTPAFSNAFAYAAQCGQISANALAQSGGATGLHFNADANGVIYTAGGGANYLPGNTVGTATNGGQYL